MPASRRPEQLLSSITLRALLASGPMRFWVNCAFCTPSKHEKTIFQSSASLLGSEFGGALENYHPITWLAHPRKTAGAKKPKSQTRESN